MPTVTRVLGNECPTNASKRQGREDEGSSCCSYTVLDIESFKYFLLFMRFCYHGLIQHDITIDVHQVTSAKEMPHQYFPTSEWRIVC